MIERKTLLIFFILLSLRAENSYEQLLHHNEFIQQGKEQTETDSGLNEETTEQEEEEQATQDIQVELEEENEELEPIPEQKAEIQLSSVESPE